MWLKAAEWNFIEMVRQRLESLAPTRLNIDRVGSLRADNPERIRMMDLAGGMRVHFPQGFTPNEKSVQTALRAAYLSVSCAVNNMLGDIIEQQLAIVMPFEVAKELVPNLHLCKAHWTRKKGKASGRPLGDLTFVDGTPLNTPETAAAAAEFYGAISHPTIEDISKMICKFWTELKERNPTALWSSLRIWKMDLKGAYTLLSFRPEDVGLFGMLLTGNLVYFQMAGIFGWAGTPAAFQVVTRAITWELENSLHSATLMYVDDIIGVGVNSEIEEDLRKTRDICTKLLGPQAVADDKTEVNRRIDVIGYTIDLDIQRVLIARKNFLKALHGFLTINVEEHMFVKTAQRLASWASRYGKICRVMRPFCGALHRLSVGRTNIYASFYLTAEAKIAIKSWCAMLCLVRYHEVEFTRTLESFAPAIPVMIAEFDASLHGAGLIWYSRSNSSEVERGVCTVDLSFLRFGDDSSFQNLSEFIGAILGVAGHIILGHQGQSLTLRGDSVTALTWALTERSRGSIVTNAAMVWAILCTTADVDIREIIHIAGTDNWRCDELSRRGTKTIKTIEKHAEELGIFGALFVNAQEDPDVLALISLCDPPQALDSDEKFVKFWSTAKSAVLSLVNRFPSPSRNLPTTSIASLHLET